MSRPETLVVVAGTGTDVGKTWVACRLLERLRADGLTVAARKPAQSFDVADGAAPLVTDADHLGLASGQPVDEVCPRHRWYEIAMAPPMAADVLGRPPIAMADLVAELAWPDGIAVGLVETAGGVRSPLAHDGDGAELIRRLAPDMVAVVADAGLGVIHNVRATVASTPAPAAVFLNRYNQADRLHRANRSWLSDRDGMPVAVTVDDLVALIGGQDPSIRAMTSRASPWSPMTSKPSSGMRL